MDERVSVLNGEMLNLAGGLPNGERLLDGLDGTTCTLASITAAYNKLVKSKITKDSEERMKTGIDRVTKEMRFLEGALVTEEPLIFAGVIFWLLKPSQVILMHVNFDFAETIYFAPRSMAGDGLELKL